MSIINLNFKELRLKLRIKVVLFRYHFYDDLNTSDHNIMFT